LCGVVTANKAGLQAVIAKVVIDATPAGAVAEAAGARREPWGVETLRVSRPRRSPDRKTREWSNRTCPCGFDVVGDQPCRARAARNVAHLCQPALCACHGFHLARSFGRLGRVGGSELPKPPS
jgi:hypothetical protein